MAPTDKSLSEIAAALDGKPSGGGFTCLCPAHEDTTASLSLSESGGRILFHCHAGCSQEAVLDALRERGLWSGNGNGHNGTARPAAKPQKVSHRLIEPAADLSSLQTFIDSAWSREQLGEPELASGYRDERGRFVFAVIRYRKPGGGKTIRPVCMGVDGSWKWGQPLAQDRPLLHLPELLTNPTMPVLMVEGELKADIAGKALAGKMIVTTWCGGAEAPSRTNLAPLAERDVTIWPDADEPGLRAALAIRNRLPKARILRIEDKPQAWDCADAAAEGIDLETFIHECPTLPGKSSIAEPVLESNFFYNPTHGLAADILFDSLGTVWIFERFGADGRGEFYRRIACSYETVLNARHQAREILEDKITAAFEQEKKSRGRDDARKVYEAAGKALGKVRTKDFLSSALALFSERIARPSIPWNVTPEALPTRTRVIDFSADAPFARDAQPDEFFRDPLPVGADDILSAGPCPKFEAFIGALFPDAETQVSALHCLGACIANKPQKTFWLWNNREGDGGKNTLMDLLRLLLPGRIRVLKGALVLYRGDKGERRFGEIELRGATAGFLDEVGGTFDIGQIKRLTSLSTIRGEAKGRDSVEFMQTWALVALCNELPRFEPATDGAFLSRLFVLPFGSVFYATEEARTRHLSLGVEEPRLHPARDKAQLMEALMAEHAQILSALIAAYQDMRGNHAGKPFESDICRRAREAYRSANDTAELFFDECLKRDDGGRVSYADLQALYVKFSGDQRASTREVARMITERFTFASIERTHGTRYVRGISTTESLETAQHGEATAAHGKEDHEADLF